MTSKIKRILSNKVARNSAIVFIGTMATNFGAYVYQLIIIRVLGPEQYSEFAALLSLLFLLSVPAMVLQLVLTKYFAVKKAENEMGEARTLYVNSLKGVTIVSVVGFLIYLPLIPHLQNLLHIQSVESFIFLYLIVVDTFVITSCVGALNGFQKFFASTINTTILTAVRLLSGLLFASAGVAAALFGNLLSNIISLLFFFFSIRFLFKNSPKKVTIQRKEIIRFAVPTLLSTLGMTAFFNIDVVLVKHFFDTTQAGIYASLTIFGKIIFFAASPIIIVIFPMIVEKKAQKKNYQALFILGLIGILSLSFTIVFAYFISAPLVTKILFGDKFITAAPYLGAYGVFMAFVTIVNYLMTVCLAINKTKAGIIVLVGAIVEFIVIILYHASISQVIGGISLVSGMLIFVLLLYYRYGWVENTELKLGEINHEGASI